MKKSALLIISLLFSFGTMSAQYAVVVDEGGFVNVYDDEKEELDRLGSDGVVAVLEVDENWALVDYTKYGEYAASSGYVKKENLIDIASYVEIPMVADSAEYVVLSNDEITIKLATKLFVEEDNKITHFSEENENLITAIEDAPFWGTKIGMPAIEYKSITFTRGGDTIDFPEESFFNLFNPHLSLTKAYYDDENDIVYIFSPNGDSSCPYTVLWVVESDDYAIHYIFD